jgi:hypothetical protein
LKKFILIYIKFEEIFPTKFGKKLCPFTNAKKPLFFFSLSLSLSLSFPTQIRGRGWGLGKVKLKELGKGEGKVENGNGNWVSTYLSVC